MRNIYLTCLVSLVSAVAAAQTAGDPVHIHVGRAGRTLVAVPDFVTAPGRESLGAELTNVIRYDLEFTGLFDLLPDVRYPAGFTGFTSDSSKIDFQAWRDTKAEFVVYAYITVEGDRLIAECRLFELFAGQQVVGQRLEATHEWRRMLAHKFSDEIVLYLTGERGIATTQLCFSGGKTGSKEIYVVDYDGANLRPATQHGSISILPKFAPDGNRIAYVSFKDRYPFIYVLDLLTGKSTGVSKDVGMNVSPSWSPDGTQLALALSKDANAEIYVMGANGSGKRRLTQDRSLETSPVFSPDGSRIAFVSDRAGGAQIYVMPATGGSATRLSMQGGQSMSPSWSPNGKQIAYVVERGGYQVFVMDADGRNPRQLTTSGSNEAPSWSPDSRHVVFSSNRTGRAQLWTVNVEIGEERPVPNIELMSQGPSWGPRRQ